MTRVFISGPMSSNRPAFDTEAARLRLLGHIAINPFDLVYPSSDFESCMTIALRALRECDEISMLPGWEDSPGAVREYQAAVRLGLPITLPCTLDAEREFAMLMLRIAVAADRQASGMHCEPGDDVLIIKGKQAGAVGEVLCASQHPGYWTCKFPRPLRNISGVFRTTLDVRDVCLVPVSGIPDVAIDSQSVGGVRP